MNISSPLDDNIVDNRRLADDKTAPRIFSKSVALEVAELATKFTDDSGYIKITISSWWGGGQRWSRNRTLMSSDQRDVTVKIQRRKNGGRGEAQTNQIDQASLKGVVGIADYYATMGEGNRALDRMMEQATWTPLGLNVWSDKTFNANILNSAAAIKRTIEKAAGDTLQSAGYIGTTGSTALVFIRDEWGRISTEWGEVTEATCSMTVRHPKGLGSGWAARTYFDISKINIDAIATRAYEKCKLSLTPIRIEPGRYTTILEPPAVGELFKVVVASLRRRMPESGRKETPIFGGHDRSIGRFYSKLGWKILDERVNLYHDPKDPLVGTHPSAMVNRVDLITNGVLTAAFNDYTHELIEMYELNPNIQRSSFRVDGTGMTTEEIIKSTKRGILVSKLTQLQVIDQTSLLCTGLTRDGVWLIENGAIVKSISNFRWVESPLFVFNNIDQIGIEEPISSHSWSRDPLEYGFHLAQTNIVVPTIKVRDFNFSSLIDAI